MSERLTAEEFEEIERGAQYDLTGPQAEAVCREVRAAWAERDGLRARLAVLEAQAGAQREALLRAEWGHWGGQSEVCPACRGSEVAEDETCGAAGHREGCPLAAALASTSGTHAAAILTLVAEWERANAEHYAYWQTQGYEREREEQLRERVHSAQGRLLAAARETP